MKSEEARLESRGPIFLPPRAEVGEGRRDLRLEIGRAASPRQPREAKRC
jgi:hypothetical protein